MKRSLSRREVLKLFAALPAGVILPRLIQSSDFSLQSQLPQNVIIVVFDALSAKNISLYGYPRRTMPNLERIAERGIVYHNHYAGGNFTTPGVASLLTGTYPWTHRAIGLGTTIIKAKAQHNLFHAFAGYYRLAYSHNNFVNSLLRQIRDDVDYIKRQKDLFVSNPLAFDRLFPLDNDIASVAWERSVKKGADGYSYSLFLSEIYEKYAQRQMRDLRDLFPRGITRIGEDDYFLLEQAIDWVSLQVSRATRPFIGYFHFLPPHRPYCPRREYVGAFDNDTVGSFEKPKHIFNQSGNENPISLKYQANQRKWYDEFILYADAELGRLYNSLQANGVLENTWFIFTSDHGEMFERGIFGHRTPALFQPVVHIPLVIVPPGQRERRDVYPSTSAVDLLPTLLHITGQPPAEWTEGRILPPFAEPSPERSVYAVEAKYSNPVAPLSPASVMLVKGKYKLTYYFDYEQLRPDASLFELYDLEGDPEELRDLKASEPRVFNWLKEELLEKLWAADLPYRS